jgi:mannosyltransferase
MMLWGIGAKPYWGDEADTMSAVSRTVPQLVRLLGRIDAVHGLYYLLLWPVVQVAGTGEVVTRLPSAVAMAAAAAGVTLIGRRLVSPRAGLCAGLLFAVLPTVTVQGQDARPYAMVTAAAAASSYLLVRAAADPRPAWFAGYGLSIAVTGYFELFALLLVPAHALTLIGLPRRGGDRRVLLRRWLLAVTAAGVTLVPVIILGWAQRGQIAWIPRPGWNDASDLTATLIAGSVPAAVAIGLLGLLFLLRGTRAARWTSRSRMWLRREGPGRGLAWLALPWLLLPPVTLVAVSFIKPVYFSRYVTFCVPAVALLAGAGLAAMRWWAGVSALALIVALIAPGQVAMRVPGGGTRMVAQFLSAHERPGDAIVYPEPSIPPWYIAYPQGFGQLRDLSLDQTPAASDRLFATTVPVAVLLRREQGVRRIWIIPVRGDRNPASYLAPGFRLTREWDLGGYQPVLLYTRAG